MSLRELSIYTNASAPQRDCLIQYGIYTVDNLFACISNWTRKTYADMGYIMQFKKDVINFLQCCCLKLWVDFNLMVKNGVLSYGGTRPFQWMLLTPVPPPLPPPLPPPVSPNAPAVPLPPTRLSSTDHILPSMHGLCIDAGSSTDGLQSSTAGLQHQARPSARPSPPMHTRHVAAVGTATPPPPPPMSSVPKTPGSVILPPWALSLCGDPHDLCCPIGLAVMTEPVRLRQTGNVFERSRIVDYLAKVPYDPVTGEALRDLTFCIDLDMKKRCDAYREAQREPPKPVATPAPHIHSASRGGRGPGRGGRGAGRGGRGLVSDA